MRLITTNIKKSLLLITLASASVSTFAETRLDAKKEIESYSHHARIEILQIADQCIQKAETQEDYAECEKKEQQAREENKKQVFLLHKEKIVSKIEERMKKAPEHSEHYAKSKAVLSCAKSAKDGKTLKACLPERKPKK